MIRKIVPIVLLALVALTLTACGISTTAATTAPVTTAATTVTTASTTAALTTTQRVFTAQDLAQYDGDGGTTAYIAVNGIVYDVTGVDEWTNGWHKGVHLAGTDATAAFADSPHSASFLNQLDVVGTLAD